jgi:hypothetical protein
LTSFKGRLDTAWAHDQELICANWLFAPIEPDQSRRTIMHYDFLLRLTERLTMTSNLDGRMTED